MQLFFGKFAGGAIAAGVCLAIAVFCWKTRRDSASSDRFKLVVPLILSADLVISPIWPDYNFVFLLPAALLVFHWRDQVLEMKPLQAAIISFSGLILGWQWIAAAALSTVGLVSASLAQSWTVLPWLPILFAPVFVLVSLALIARHRLSRASPQRTHGITMRACQPDYPSASN